MHILVFVACIFQETFLRHFLWIALVVFSCMSNHLSLQSTVFCDNCSGGNHCNQHWCLPCNWIFSQKTCLVRVWREGFLTSNFWFWVFLKISWNVWSCPKHLLRIRTSNHSSVLNHHSSYSGNWSSLRDRLSLELCFRISTLKQLTWLYPPLQADPCSLSLCNQNLCSEMILEKSGLWLKKFEPLLEVKLYIWCHRSR